MWSSRKHLTNSLKINPSNHIHRYTAVYNVTTPRLRLAIKDTGSCITVYSLTVYYREEKVVRI